MMWTFMLLGFVFHFETAQAAFAKHCAELVGDRNTVRAEKINYETKWLTDLNGQKMNLPMLPGPFSVQTSLLSQFILTTDPSQTQSYTQKLLSRQRVQNPAYGGQKGIGVPEQWIFYFKSRLPEILNQMLQFQSAEFSPEQLGILKQIQALDLHKIDLVMVDDPSQFSEPGVRHSIARTEGQPGQPIYLNAILLLDVKPYTPKPGESGWIQVNSMSPFDYTKPPATLNFKEADEFLKRVEHQADIEKLGALVSILFHELGHYLKIPDDAEKTLDQFASQVSRVFMKGTQDLSMGHKNHPWLKYLHWGFQDSKKSGRLVLFDSMNIYDVTDKVLQTVKQRTGLSFSSYTFANMRWEPEHTVDFYHYTSPDVMLLDVILETDKGLLKVPVRLAHYFAASVASGSFVYPEAPWKTRPVQIRIDASHLAVEMQVMKDKIVPVDRIQAPNVTDWIAHQAKSYKPGDVWKATSQMELPSSELPIEARVYFNSPVMVNSGFIKRSRKAFKAVRIEPIGAKKILVHCEMPIEKELRGGDYSIYRIDLIYKDKRILEIEPNQVESVKILNEIPKASLKWIGVQNIMFESPKKFGIVPQALYKMDGLKGMNFGGIVPIVLEVENLGAPQKLSLHGRVHFKGSGYTDIEGFHIDVIGAAGKSPLIAGYQQTVKNNRRQIMVFVNVPKIINGKAVSALFIDSAYGIDENLNDFFDPAPLGFGVDVP